MYISKVFLFIKVKNERRKLLGKIKFFFYEMYYKNEVGFGEGSFFFSVLLIFSGEIKVYFYLIFYISFVFLARNFIFIELDGVLFVFREFVWKVVKSDERGFGNINWF